MSPKIVNKAEKRREIGQRALACFAREGAVVTSMSQIARAVGVGKGTLYEYFRSKEELITYAMELYVEAIEKQVSRMLDGIADPKERLRFYAISVAEHIIDDPKTAGVMLAIFQLLISDQSNNQPAALKGMFRQARQTITSILREGAANNIFTEKAGREAETIAINCIAIVDGLWMHAMASGDIDLKHQINHYLDGLYRLIEAETV